MWKKKLRNKNKKIKRHSSTPMSLYLGANLSTPLKSPDDSKPPLVSFSAKTPDIIQKHTNCCAPSESLMYWYCELINYYCCFKLTRYESKSHSVVSDSLWPHGLNSPWNSPGQNTGVGSRSLLQGIIPTQGLNPGLPHCGRILYQLSCKRSPRILEWVAYTFSSGSSWHRNRTGVSCIAGGFFTNWAMRESRSS